jgi:DNA-binding transcriptional regulator GbsR (MarR family)
MKIAAERKRREIDPTIALLGELAEKLEGRKDVPEHVRQRIDRMHQFIGTLTDWYEDIRRIPKPTLIALMKLGARVARFVPVRGGTRATSSH